MDSAVWQMTTANVTITNFPGSTFLPKTDISKINTPLYSEGRAPDRKLVSSSSSLYSAAPAKSNVFFGGEDATHGHANTQILSKSWFNLFQGPVTIKGTFFNRSGDPNYNESYVGILPFRYVHYAALDCDPGLNGTMNRRRQGIAAGAVRTNGNAFLLNQGDLNTDNVFVKGPLSSGLNFDKWYSIEVTFEVINNDLYMTRADYNDGTSRQPLGSMVKVGPARNIGWLDSFVIMAGADDMLAEVSMYRRVCSPCLTQDSTNTDARSSNFTYTTFSGSFPQAATDFKNTPTPFAIENTTTNRAFFPNSKTCLSTAAYRNNIFFAGDVPAPRGEQPAHIASTASYNLLEGPVTMNAVFLNRSSSANYDESWFALMPSEYGSYLGPITIPVNSSEGIRVGGSPVGAMVIDAGSKTEANDTIMSLKSHSLANWGNWYEARVTWDTFNGQLRCAEYAIFVGGFWRPVWNTPVNIGPVSDYPWLGSVRVSVLADDMVDSIRIVKRLCKVTKPVAKPCQIVSLQDSFCRSNANYLLDKSFKVNGTTPSNAIYRIISFNGDYKHPHLNTYQIISNKYISLAMPPGRWEIEITTDCGKTDSAFVYLKNENILRIYHRADSTLCTSIKKLALQGFIDSINSPGGRWTWSGKNIANDTLIINRKSDSLFSYPEKISGYYTSPAGCRDTITFSVRLRNNPIVQITSVPADTICSSEVLRLSARAKSAGGLRWQISGRGNGRFSDDTSEQTIYYPGSRDIDDGKVRLKVESLRITDDPCPAASDSMVAIIRIVPVVFFNGNRNFCSDLREISCGQLIDSFRPMGGNWKWYGVNVADSILGISRKSDSLYSSYKSVTGIYNLNGCLDTATILYRVRNAPLISINTGSPLKICANSSATLSGLTKAASGVKWHCQTCDGRFSDLSNINTIYTPGVKDLQSGKIRLFVNSNPLSNDPCPAAEDSLEIIINPVPTPLVTGPVEICEHAGILLSATDSIDGGNANHIYRWQIPGNSYQGQSWNISNLNRGIYDLTLEATSSTTSCTAQVLKKGWITVHPKPVASFSAKHGNMAQKPGARFEFLNSSSLGTFPPGSVITRSQWYFVNPRYIDSSDEFEPIFMPPDDTAKYLVELIVSTNKGCADTAHDMVSVVAKTSVHLPTAFTPDDEGLFINNFYKAQADNITELKMMIFNRWGELLFETTDPAVGWNGKFMDKDCQEGVYILILHIRDLNGYNQIHKQSFHLLR